MKKCEDISRVLLVLWSDVWPHLGPRNPGTVPRWALVIEWKWVGFRPAIIPSQVKGVGYLRWVIIGSPYYWIYEPIIPLLESYLFLIIFSMDPFI